MKDKKEESIVHFNYYWMCMKASFREKEGEKKFFEGEKKRKEKK